MIHKNIYLLLSLVPLSLVCEPVAKTVIPAVPAGGVLNFNVYLSNTQDAKSMNSTVVKTSQIEKGHMKTPLFDTMQNAFKSFPASCQPGTIPAPSFFDSYKWPFLAAGVIGSYAAVCYYIIRGNYYLNQADLWSSWRAELPFDQLLAIPQTQFALELLQEIQRRYSHETTITDLVTPLSLFIQAVAQEEEELTWYNAFYGWLQYVNAQHLVPANKMRYARIKERLQRLAYYKNVFQTWASHYKMEQNIKGKLVIEVVDASSIEKMAATVQKINIRRWEGYWLKYNQMTIPEYM